MNAQWRIAALGGMMGTIAAVAAVFAAAALGYFPSPTDKQFRDYLMSHPAIVFAMSEKAQSEQADSDQRLQQNAVDKLGLKVFLNSQVAFVTGPANARKTVIEFFDYNCAHCRNSFPTVKKFYESHRNDTRFAFIEYPIFGQASEDAARAALAARNQPDKYLAFHFALMGEEGATGAGQIVDAAKKAGLDMNKLTADLKDPGIDRKMAAARELAKRVGVDGTPMFIVNGKVHESEVDDASLMQLWKG